MKKQIIDCHLDRDTGITICTITTENKTYIGQARCNEVDRDMMSEKTGSEIAYRRAVIKLLKDMKNTVCTELKGLNRYYYTVNQSQQFNNDNYMARMLKRQIKHYKDEQKQLDTLINEQQQQLSQWIDRKDTFYQKIRLNRKIAQSANND